LAYAGGAAAAAAAQAASSYRVKFRRREFLEFVDMAKPRVVYHRKRMHLSPGSSTTGRGCTSSPSTAS